MFREQLVQAATTPFQNVLVQNTSTNPVPVTQVGTSTTSVTGTVNLDSTDSSHLANIESALGNLKFDSSGNLKTAAQTAAAEQVTQHCLNGVLLSYRTVPNDAPTTHTLCRRTLFAPKTCTSQTSPPQEWTMRSR